jgi:LppP/LprE lipoprotein
MRSNKQTSMLLACVVVGAVVLTGCGSSATKTVSVSSSPSPAGAAKTTASGSTQPTPPTPTSTSTTSTGENGAATTRTTTAPAFTKQTGGGEGLDGATAVVKAHGYTPNDTSDYHAGQTLRVLVGTRTGSGDGYAQQAFFFVDGRYIGTDASQPSASVKVVGQSDTEVTLAYPLYRANDPLCCPGGGQATVHFQLNNGRLVPLDPIPPTSSRTGLSRQ